MIKWLFIIFQFVFVASTQAQTSSLGPLLLPTTDQQKSIDKFIDSLRSVLSQAKDDTTKADVLLLLSQYHFIKYEWDFSFGYAQQAIGLSEKSNYEKGLFSARDRLASLFNQTGSYGNALQLTFTNLPIAEKYKDTLRLFATFWQLSVIYNNINDFSRQITYARRLQQLAPSTYLKKQNNPENFIQISLLQLAHAFGGLNQNDSALYYYHKVYENALSFKDNQWLALANGNLGDLLLQLGNTNEAWSCYRIAIDYAKTVNRFDLIAYCHLGLAKIFQQKNQLDSALHYAKVSLSDFHQIKLPAGELQSASFLDSLYTKENQMDSAHHYLAIAVALKDSLFNQKKVREIQNLQFAETLRAQQIEQERKEAQQQYATKLKIYSLVGGLVVALLVAYFLHRNNLQKHKTNIVLHQKNEEIQNTLTKLKSTQAQLIQSEKMASLGELTAGIAHEIQNPLNFVNNFSELNKELVDELEGEANKANMDEVKTIAKNIRDNDEKILHHGKRADAIVKGMLQHSRASTGKKELADINALADEYLRLSYHGMRAKDKSFNATLQTDFDATIGKINVAPQDIGRVLLNLFNNAFYAVIEKKKLVNGGYEPTVSVCTKKVDGKIEIRIRDNGTGVSQKVIAKIFQPFFTTKPTGQGTGLGLSLSYDIIKAHSGEIKVETKEGEFTELIIYLPMQ